MAELVQTGFSQDLVEDDLCDAVEDVLDKLGVRRGRDVRVDVTLLHARLILREEHLDQEIASGLERLRPVVVGKGHLARGREVMSHFLNWPCPASFFLIIVLSGHF